MNAMMNSKRKLAALWTVSIALSVTAAVLVTASFLKDSEANPNRTYSLSTISTVDEDGTSPLTELAFTFDSTELESGYTTWAMLYDAQHATPSAATIVLSSGKWSWDGSGDHGGAGTQADDADSSSQYTLVFKTYNDQDILLETHTESHTVP